MYQAFPEGFERNRAIVLHKFEQTLSKLRLDIEDVEKTSKTTQSDLTVARARRPLVSEQRASTDALSQSLVSSISTVRNVSAVEEDSLLTEAAGINIDSVRTAPLHLRRAAY